MKLNSCNLVMSAMFGGRQGHRPPVGNPTSIACHGLMDKAGGSFPQAHLDARAMSDLALAGWEVLGFDTVVPEYSVVQEAAALGTQVDWGDRDKMPDVRDFPNADFSDILIPVDFLEKPSCRVVLDAISILRRQVGGKVAIIGKVMEPWRCLNPILPVNRSDQSDRRRRPGKLEIRRRYRSRQLLRLNLVVPCLNLTDPGSLTITGKEKCRQKQGLQLAA